MRVSCFRVAMYPEKVVKDVSGRQEQKGEVMDFVQYKCPCCGAPLHFSGTSQKFACESCGNEYEPETLKKLARTDENAEEGDLGWEYQKQAIGAEKTKEGLYICPSCGAEIEADENTVSTKCPYCDNVVVIRASASGEFEPDVIIPFQIKGDRAKQMLEQFCKGKHLLPKGFKDKSYLKNLKGRYLPYWLFDCNVNADMDYTGTRTRAWSSGDYDYVETSYFLVKRSGKMEFYHIPVDGNTAMEDETTESVEPYDYSQLTEFNPAYLAGYDTDKYDVESKTAQARAKERLYNSAESVVRGTVHGYDTVTVRHRHLASENSKVSYALLPVWLFETVYRGKNYQFAINGQTGKMVGELPVDMGAFWKYLFCFTGIGTVILSVAGILLFGGVL